MERIVLVGDDAERCLHATDILSAVEYHVTPCFEPGSAFACVCNAQPDLVVIDITGDLRRSCRLVSQLKEQEETAVIPVLVSWPPGISLESCQRTFQERGVHLIPQPLSADQLPGYIAAALPPPRSLRRIQEHITHIT